MKKKLFVSGMHCEHCKRRVTEAIEGINGVRANVDLKKSTVQVSSKSNISDETLIDAVTNAGYTVTGIETV
jgi:copper chaperone CopZ